MGVTLVVLGEGCPGTAAREVTSRPSEMYCSSAQGLPQCTAAAGKGWLAKMYCSKQAGAGPARCTATAHRGWLADEGRASLEERAAGQERLVTAAQQGGTAGPASSPTTIPPMALQKRDPSSSTPPCCACYARCAPAPWAASTAPAAWRPRDAPAPVSPQTPPTREGSPASAPAVQRRAARWWSAQDTQRACGAAGCCRRAAWATVCSGSGWSVPKALAAASQGITHMPPKGPLPL